MTKVSRLQTELEDQQKQNIAIENNLGSELRSYKKQLAGWISYNDQLANQYSEVSKEKTSLKVELLSAEKRIQSKEKKIAQLEGLVDALA